MSNDTLPMDVAEDAAATTNCSNQHEGMCVNLERTEVDDSQEDVGEGGGGGERTISSASSDSSVAVNCHSYPTEVVVHGRKVQKVHLVFPPFPPTRSSTSGSEWLAGHPVGRRVASVDRNRASSESLGHRRRSCRVSGSTVAQATDDLGSLPLSQEESSGCLADGATSVKEKTPVGCVPPLDQEVGGVLETKMRQEIQNGISFIEVRLVELIRLNQQLRSDLERETRNVEVLRERISMTESLLQGAETENSELKQQLDCKEKESMRLGEQAKEEWRRRVGLEETLMELKRNKDLEAKSFKEQLEARNAEIRTLETELNHRKQVTEKMESRAETVELAARVNQLEETLVRLQREKDRVDEVASNLEKDLEAWKVKHESGCRDLELQMGRFQALRKSYSDLKEENQRLARTTQRVLRDPVFSACPDFIRIIDLPEQTKSGGSLKDQLPGHVTSQTSIKMAGAKDLRIATRKKSQDSSGSDRSFSLPPVQKSNK